MEEIETKKSEYLELKKQFQNFTEYYDSLLLESKSQNEHLETELNKLRSDKKELENANIYLTEQLRLLRQNLVELSSLEGTKEVYIFYNISSIFFINF